MTNMIISLDFSRLDSTVEFMEVNDKKMIVTFRCCCAFKSMLSKCSVLNDRCMTV